MSVPPKQHGQRETALWREPPSHRQHGRWDEVAENFLISNTKRAALRHCSCISHVLAASCSTPGHPPVFESLFAALLWQPSPMRHRHCPGTAGQAPQLGCCSLQAPVPGSRGRFAEGRCGQRSNVSSCPQRLQHQPIGLVWPFGPVTQWPGSRNHYPLLLNLLPGTALQTHLDMRPHGREPCRLCRLLEHL